MLSLQGTIDLLNDRQFKIAETVVNWQKVYYGMSLHIAGILPQYKELRYGTWVNVRPFNWGCEAYQAIFETQLFSKHPREHEATRNWRLSQYKPFTKDPFQRCIQVTTGAIFQDSGYSITIQDKDDNDYIWGNNFHGKHLVGYLSDKFQNICEDPNGLFVTAPKRPRYETGNSVEPEIWFISTKYIRFISNDEIIFEHNGYHWTINTIGYFRFTQDDKGQFYHVDDAQGGYFMHALGRIPYHVAGGRWNTQGFYDSWLDAAKAIADEYVGAKSSEQLVNKEASHPFIIEAAEECAECDGTGKVRGACQTHGTTTCDCSYENFYLASCDKCGGSGTISHNPADRLVVPKEDMANDLVKIVNPDVGVNEFHAKNNADMFNALLRALHLHYIDQAQSGVAKDKDMETRYQFIQSISNDLFDRLITGFIRDITALRHVRSINGVIQPYESEFVIVKPTQFQIKTSYDLLFELTEAQKAEVPSYQLEALVEDYVDKQFGGNEVLKRKTSIINQMDVLAVKTDADISLVLLNNGVDQRGYQLHYQLPKILDKLIRDKGNEWFLTASYDVIEADAMAIFNTIFRPMLSMQPDTTIERVNV